MGNQTNQLRVTLPDQLQQLLQDKASEYGLSMSSYVKNLIINDIKGVRYPTFKATPMLKDSYRQAKTAEKNGELIEADDLDSYLDQL